MSPAPAPRVHWLQHVTFEDLGAIRPWLAARGAHATATRFHATPILPRLDEFDWLIVMGGPMAVTDHRAYPWLTAEKHFIEEAITGGKVVLGICLGAQLVASALGARVFRAPEREIGWFPIQPAGGDPQSPFAELFATGRDIFHWHADTFDLPFGTVHLARTAACPHQAFALGDRVLGLQFHPEMTLDGAAALVENCASDLTPGPWVQPAGALLADPERFRAANALMDAILDRLERVWRAE